MQASQGLAKLILSPSDVIPQTQDFCFLKKKDVGIIGQVKKFGLGPVHIFAYLYYASQTSKLPLTQVPLLTQLSPCLHLARAHLSLQIP